MVRDSRDIRKKEAFEAFLKTLQDGTIAHWQNIAAAIGVEGDTITAWKRLPEAQEAIKRGISTALDGMQKAGSKDWRMWESKLKMLGIAHTHKSVVELSAKISGRPLIPLLRGASKGVFIDDEGSIVGKSNLVS